MNRVIVFEVFVIALVVAGALEGSLGLERAGGGPIIDSRVDI
jgi:hypothetical protein